MAADWTFVRTRSAEVARRLFDDFDQKRRGLLTEVAREFCPLAVPGLARSVEELADETPYDEGHRMLTTKPMDCLRKGAAGFHGNLTSPARRWFRLRMPSFGAATRGEEQGAGTETDRALERLTDAVEWTFHRGGVYPQLYKLYEHALCFGFGCMLVTGDPRRVVKARTLRVGTYAMGVDEDGLVCRVARKFSWTAEQIMREFTSASVPERVKEAADRGDSKRRWTVWNLVEPNGCGDLRAYDRVAREIGLSDDMVYRSVYWLEEARSDDPSGGVLGCSGFTVKPIVAPRMDAELGDVYGRGRGMDGLDLARGVQSFEYDILKISGQRAQPAVVASSEFKDAGLKLGRGQVNYCRFGEQRGAMVYPALAQAPDSTSTRQDRIDAENELADLFFNTAFATIDALKNNSGVKTATEVDALVRENMERLNPVVTNLDHELLDPLVTVVTHYALQAGVCPMEDADVDALGAVDVEYVSQIHLASRQTQMGGVTSWIQFVGGLSQMKPAVGDLLDEDGAARAYAEMLGVPAPCVATRKMVEQRRAERAQMQKMQMENAQLQQLGAAAKLGAMPTDEGHAGGLLARGLGAG